MARLKPFVQRYFPKLHFSGVGASHNKGQSGGYEDKKQRPAREAYLLHSVERSDESMLEGLGKYNGISVQSDVLVSRSNMAANGFNKGDGQQSWQYTSQVQSLNNVYRGS